MARYLRRGASDMTEGPIWRHFLEFSVPMALGLLFQQLYNTVDSVVVGRFVGKEALAAVGSVGSIVNMLVGFCAGLATGAGVVISQCYGAHRDKELNDAVQTTILSTLVLCVAVTLLGVWIVPAMLNFMQTPADVLPMATEYLTIYFAGVSGLLLYNVGSGILRAVGDSRRPLYFLIFSAVVNTMFDLLFVIKFHLGVAGVAYATILAQALSALLVLYSLSHDNAAYGIRWRQLRICRSMLKRILSIGLPSGVQQLITAFSNVFVQSYINFFGSACMAGWSSYGKLDQFVLIPVQSIALASTTFVGQNFGAKNLKRARLGARQALYFSLGVTFLLSVGMMLLARPLLLLFTADEEVIYYGVKFLRLALPFYVIICFNQIFAGAMRGIGNARAPMIIMLFSFVLFRQIYLYVIKLFGNAFEGVALAYPIGWVMCSVLMLIAYRRSALCRPDAARGEGDAL